MGKAAFTIIELLVVLAIIAILAAFSVVSFHHVLEDRNRKQAKVELEALRTALVSYRSDYGGYPKCPQEICTPGECLFLSLAGFHNEKGGLQLPPYRPLVPPSIFGYDLSSFDAAEIPNVTHNEGKSLMLWLSQTLDKDVAFLDPWGSEYVYEYPREDGEKGSLLFSMGPDGKTGDGFHEDDIK